MTEPSNTTADEGRLPLIVAAFGVFIAADDLMVVATMLRPIIDDLGLILPDDLDATAWIVNVYLIAYIAAMPLAGKLSDRFGRRALFVAALAVFAAGSLIVPSTDSFRWLLVGRALSAFGGGALVPIALAVAGDVYQGARRTKALGLLGAIETLGWVWGPLYGAALVRLLSWEWQFYLNLPLAVIGIGAGWAVLDPTRRATGRADWIGAALLTVTLVALNVALLAEARVQTVTGLDELTGDGGSTIAGPWLYPVAAVALWLLVVHVRRIERQSPTLTERAGSKSSGSDGAGPSSSQPQHGGHGPADSDTIEPVVSARLVRSPGVRAALSVNALVGVGLVIALVNVPLFVNIVENDSGIGPTAVLAGALLTALTATMAVTSYAGGALAARHGNRLPTVVGCALAVAGFAAMALTWSTDTSRALMAAELAVIGFGIGLVLAPTSAAVVDAAAENERGTAAGLVIVFRLIGFSIGLAALTAWGLHRYTELRDAVSLPPLDDPGYRDAAADAAVDITTTALAETFAGSALALVAAVVIASTLPIGSRR